MASGTSTVESVSVNNHTFLTWMTWSTVQNVSSNTTTITLNAYARWTGGVQTKPTVSSSLHIGTSFYAGYGKLLYYNEDTLLVTGVRTVKHNTSGYPVTTYDLLSSPIFNGSSGVYISKNLTLDRIVPVAPPTPPEPAPSTEICHPTFFSTRLNFGENLTCYPNRTLPNTTVSLEMFVGNTYDVSILSQTQNTSIAMYFSDIKGYLYDCIDNPEIEVTMRLHTFSSGVFTGFVDTNITYVFNAPQITIGADTTIAGALLALNTHNDTGLVSCVTYGVDIGPNVWYMSQNVSGSDIFYFDTATCYPYLTICKSRVFVAKSEITASNGAVIGMTRVAFTVAIDQVANKPTIGSVSYISSYPANIDGFNTFMGNNKTLVKGKTQMIVTITGAAAKNGSTISSYKVVYGGVTYSSTSNVITIPAESINVESSPYCYVIDTRDNGILSDNLSIPITKYWDYTIPIIPITSSSRNEDGMGTKAILDFASVVSALMATKSYYKVQYQFCEYGMYMPYSRIIISDFGALSDINHEFSIQLTPDFDIEKKYSFVIEIIDFFSTTQMFTLMSTSSPELSIRADRVGINTIPRPGYALDMVGDGIVKGLLYSTLDGTLPCWRTPYSFEQIYPTYGYANGTLITTNIVSMQDAMIVLEIKGNSYGELMPIDTIVQIYRYSTTVPLFLKPKAINKGLALTVKAFIKDGVVCFWVANAGYAHTMFYKLSTHYVTNPTFIITNVAEPPTSPTVTEKIAIPNCNALRTSSFEVISMYNGWSNYGGLYQGLHYSFDGKTVLLEGLICGGTFGSTIATLPVGRRPMGSLICGAKCAGGIARIDITAVGDILLSIPAETIGTPSTFVSLAGINFTTM